MRAPEGQNLGKTATLNKKKENEEEAQNHKKNAKKEVSDHWGTIVPQTLAPGAPRGRPRARGVYLINQVMKE